MSLPIFTWVLDHSEERLGNRLVLLALAEHAHDDGTKAFPSIETLTRRTRLSERQVRNCLRALQASEAVEQTGKTKSGTNIYTVRGPFNRGANIAAANTSGGQSATGKVSRIAPDPSVPVISSSSSSKGILPKSIGGAAVTDDENQIASLCLAMFNSLGGTKYGGREWRAMIIRRAREHPELDVEQHLNVTEDAFRRPWWTGAATPSVIWGNGRVFDRLLNDRAVAARKVEAKRSPYDRPDAEG